MASGNYTSKHNRNQPQRTLTELFALGSLCDLGLITTKAVGHRVISVTKKEKTRYTKKVFRVSLRKGSKKVRKVR